MQSTDHSSAVQSEGTFAGLAMASLPGLMLCVGIAGLAFAAKSLSGMSAVSPMVAAIVIGMIVGNIYRPGSLFRPGLTLAIRPFLRAGIVLVGFQITLGEIVDLGAMTAFVVIVTMASAFYAILGVGLFLRVPKPLTEVIAAGTSVCGASAIIAAAPAARASDEDVAYALATVTLFGTLSLLAFPIVGRLVGLDPTSFGIWAGATIHEVGQVSATAFQAGDVAGQTGMIAKLLRVALLAAVIFALVLRRRVEDRGSDEPAATRPPFPTYVLLFMACVGLNSLLPVPAPLIETARMGSVALMTMALAAMGLMTDVRALAACGVRPLCLGLFGWVFISAMGLGMILFLGVR